MNAAAYTAVDEAESEPELAGPSMPWGPLRLHLRPQSSAPGWFITLRIMCLTAVAQNPGMKQTGLPLNVYGTTKLEGEAANIASGCRYLIFRTSWVFAARGENFAKKMLRLAQEHDRLTIVDDQIGAPTGADLLADVTAHAIRMALHIAKWQAFTMWLRAGETSWCGYARFVLNFARQAGDQAKDEPGRSCSGTVQRIFPSPAMRPKNSRLNTKKLQSTFNLQLPPWQTGVARMLTEILENHHDRSVKA